MTQMTQMAQTQMPQMTQMTQMAQTQKPQMTQMAQMALGGSELRDLREHFFGVAVHLHAVPAFGDLAVGSNQIRDAGHAHVLLAVHRLFLPGAVLVDDGVIGIGEQRRPEVQAVEQLGHQRRAHDVVARHEPVERAQDHRGVLADDVEQQIEVLARAAELTAEAMPNLRTMDNLTEYWIEVNRLENQADQIHRKLLAHLFNGKYDAIEVLKLKQIVDVLEEAADAFEHVANTVETIAVKES